ncbi:MAG TPA: hypothetical protein VEU51_15780 [Candidatus Acidoferrales bacterium]|nr:hypothetical protein [Candidatus Acidoferrales bacterium]
MLLLTATVVGIAIALNYLLNPYGAWRTALINPIFRKIEHERVVTPYLLRTAGPETILLGSSRVLMGMRIEQGERAGFMNAALTAATIDQLSRIVSVALENPHLKRIVWGVDFFSFNTGWDKRDPNFDARMSGNIGVKVEDTLLSSAVLGDGYDYARRAIRGESRLPATMTAAMPWPMTLICEQLGATKYRGLQVTPTPEIEDELAQDLPDYAAYRPSREFMLRLRETVAAARARGIDVVMFVPPMSEYELELIRQSGQWETFQEFKRQLALIGPYWDFSGYNTMARTDELFMHVMHFKIAVGQLMLRIVLGADTAPCSEAARIVTDAAVRVNNVNADAEIVRQDRLRADATRAPSLYSRLAARAIARRGRDRAAHASEYAGQDETRSAAMAATR